MTLPASGPLAMTDIQTEFGGTNPIGLNEYYAGGGLVPPGTSGTYGAVPSSGALSIQNFYGTSNYIPVYIEELFQTWLYTGNGSTQTITNGIDLSGKGGLLWIKNRTNSADNALYNMLDGYSSYNTIAYQSSNSTSGLVFTSPTTVVSTSSSVMGFGLNGSSTVLNASANNYVSWTFRKQPKFFDVVTYTGNGANGRTVAHNLGSVPGCIIVKRTDSDGDWMVYHRSIGNTKILRLQTTGAELTGVYWNNTTPTEAVFTVNDMGATTANPNASGATYVAYLFAHDAGGFGLTGTDNVISCGSYTVSGNEATVTLGYEPQWTLTKRTDSTDEWRLIDVVRGSSTKDGQNRQLYANLTDAEGGGTAGPHPTATGFTVQGVADGAYIYIAIRRGPMEVPETGTSVFTPTVDAGYTDAFVNTGFPLDSQIDIRRAGGNSYYPSFVDRLRGVSTLPNNTTYNSPFLVSSSADVESTAVRFTNGWNNTGFQIPSYNSNNVYYSLRRAPNFFDVVCYTGTGVTGQTYSHNLGVVPEMMIVKSRTVGSSWYVYTATAGNTNTLQLNSASSVEVRNVWGNTTPTASVFSVGVNGNGTNNPSEAYVAYLFASCPGVSKVGSYTGTGTTQVINCGFTGGARFVLIKRVSAFGQWYVWDSARGIVAGNDPYLMLNNTAAEVTSTDYVDTASTGFEISSTAPADINGSGESFIFLAIS